MALIRASIHLQIEPVKREVRTLDCLTKVQVARHVEREEAVRRHHSAAEECRLQDRTSCAPRLRRLRSNDPVQADPIFP